MSDMQTSGEVRPTGRVSLQSGPRAAFNAAVEAALPQTRLIGASISVRMDLDGEVVTTVRGVGENVLDGEALTSTTAYVVDTPPEVVDALQALLSAEMGKIATAAGRDAAITLVVRMKEKEARDAAGN